ncbi:SdpI family protein [Kocuria rosea]|uniref:SdpI family protein n=1 Tax=Kocuria rosea TaxID=1275 RepID=UPI00119DD041|nr:SdpI family protein [Kocuria rosea]
MSDDILAVIPLLFGVALIPTVGVLVTRMAAEGNLARNGAAGIRTRHTKASDAAWVAGHAAALPRVSTTVPIAVGTVVAAGAATVLGGSGWGVGVGMVGLLAVTAVLISATGPANTAARQATAAPTEDPAHCPEAQDRS